MHIWREQRVRGVPLIFWIRIFFILHMKKFVQKKKYRRNKIIHQSIYNLIINYNKSTYWYITELQLQLLIIN